MKLTLHLIVTDLRRLKLWLLLWAALFVAIDVLGFLALQYQPTGPEVRRDDLWQSYLSAGSTLTVVQWLLTFVITVLLVQGDRMVGTRAFWQTRPVAGARLLAAKLITAVVVLIVVPGVISLPWWRWCGFGLFEIASATRQIATFGAIIAIPAAAVAALTDTLTRAIVWGGLICAVSGAFEIAALAAASGAATSLPLGSAAMTGAVVLLAFSAATLVQYLWRREAVSMAIAGFVFMTWFLAGPVVRPAYPHAFGVHDVARGDAVQVHFARLTAVRQNAPSGFVRLVSTLSATLPAQGTLRGIGAVHSWQTGDRGRRYSDFSEARIDFTPTLPAALGFKPVGAPLRAASSVSVTSGFNLPEAFAQQAGNPATRYAAQLSLAEVTPRLADECESSDRTWHAEYGRGLRIMASGENERGRGWFVVTTTLRPALLPYLTGADPEFRFLCAVVERDAHTLMPLAAGREWRSMGINSVQISFRQLSAPAAEVGAHARLAAIALEETARFVRDVKVDGVQIDRN